MIIRLENHSIVWGVLLAITLVLSLTVEAQQSTSLLVSAVTLAIIIKGSLVIEALMGLREAHPLIRVMMHGYFVVIAALIVLVCIAPQLLERMTSL